MLAQHSTLTRNGAFAAAAGASTSRWISRKRAGGRSRPSSARPPPPETHRARDAARASPAGARSGSLLLGSDFGQLFAKDLQHGLAVRRRFGPSGNDRLEQLFEPGNLLVGEFADGMPRHCADFLDRRLHVVVAVFAVRGGQHRARMLLHRRLHGGRQTLPGAVVHAHHAGDRTKRDGDMILHYLVMLERGEGKPRAEAAVEYALADRLI